MIRIPSHSLVAAAGIVLAFTLSAEAAPHYLPGEVVVVFKPGVPEASIRQLYLKAGSSRKADLPLIHGQVVRIPKIISVEGAVEMFLRDPDVLFAEPNYIRRPFATVPNDPDFPLQWSLQAIEAPEAWSVANSSDDVVVAVIDSGVDYTHPDLAADIWMNDGEIPGDGIDNDGNGYVDDGMGWNFVGSQTCDLEDGDGDGKPDCVCQQDDPDVPDDPGNNDPMDDYGHGTHVSGIIAAVGNNGIGTSGVLWRGRIMPLKIIDKNACGSTSDEIQAIGYAVAQGADIINASFGGEGSSQGEKAAVRAAADAGVLFVAAAGNGGTDHVGDNNDAVPVYPAGYRLDNVVSVAASDPNDNLSAYSNFGPHSVDLAAPGDCILSTMPVGDFAMKGTTACPGHPITSVEAYLSGTSMSTPLVSGTAALMLIQNPSVSAKKIKALISLTTDARESLSGRIASSGRLNARKALLREAGSGLSGGGGGCGAVGYTDGQTTPPGTAIGFLLTIFFPLIIPVIRKLRRHRFTLPAYSRSRAGLWLAALLSASVVFGDGVPAAPAETASPFDFPHSVSIRAGVHFYPSSEYFHTNSGYVQPRDFRGPSGELEYAYRISPAGGLLLTAGVYDGGSNADTVCCTHLSFFTVYGLATPVLRFPLGRFGEGYVGAGLGYYRFRMRQTGEFDQALSGSAPGVHVLAGWRHALTARLSALLELRYAWASVPNADSLDDRVGIGGTNLSVGLSYHFPNPL